MNYFLSGLRYLYLVFILIIDNSDVVSHNLTIHNTVVVCELLKYIVVELEAELFNPMGFYPSTFQFVSLDYDKNILSIA